MTEEHNNYKIYETLPMPVAVTAGPNALSTEARSKIQSLSGTMPRPFIVELLKTWTVIFLSIYIGTYFSHWLVTLLCIFIIATRQMVLGLLLHEQVHRLGLKNKYGDWIVNLTATYPLFITTVEDYAKIHLAHHKYFFTEKDPDFLRKSGDEWSFPSDWKKIIKIILRDLTGLNTIRLILGKTAQPNMTDEFNRPNPSPKYLRIAYFGIIAIALTWFNVWTTFLLYWVIPILSITQVLIRWLAVCEHKYNLENTDVLKSTPMIKLNLWQRILLPDLNFAMHVYHHLHCGVSFSQLPTVHEIYKQEGLVDESAIFQGYRSYLKYLVSKGAY